jgi:hypothetical protein
MCQNRGNILSWGFRILLVLKIQRCKRHSYRTGYTRCICLTLAAHFRKRTLCYWPDLWYIFLNRRKLREIGHTRTVDWARFRKCCASVRMHTTLVCMYGIMGMTNSNMVNVIGPLTVAARTTTLI